eukprot:CAMPEP_0174757420 /NCGR_PEP_ID=MMETSP1094-20130205/107250_1 /TAXON_ID=156173 /ORGANISM="Chrysochromulina brevifilum, Strain UTEX LB 985" /LENGTH=69 /DNA_ID=CAMNT_0015963337 /DNA_START=524 /DNA_END=733 /DNA_ORIENTATION=+
MMSHSFSQCRKRHMPRSEGQIVHGAICERRECLKAYMPTCLQAQGVPKGLQAERWSTVGKPPAASARAL